MVIFIFFLIPFVYFYFEEQDNGVTIKQVNWNHSMCKIYNLWFFQGNIYSGNYNKYNGKHLGKTRHSLLRYCLKKWMSYQDISGEQGPRQNKGLQAMWAGPMKSPICMLIANHDNQLKSTPNTNMQDANFRSDAHCDAPVVPQAYHPRVVRRL